MSEFMSSVELGGIGDQSYDEARRRSIREGFQRLFRAADIDGDGRLGDRELEYMAHLVGTAVSDRRGSSKERTGPKAVPRCRWRRLVSKMGPSHGVFKLGVQLVVQHRTRSPRTPARSHVLGLWRRSERKGRSAP